MKKLIGLLIFGLFSIQAFAVVGYSNGSPYETKVEKGDSELSGVGMEEFMTMTPKKYKETTGKKMGFFAAMKMKIAQKILKKTTNKVNKTSSEVKGKKRASGGLPQIAYILLAVFFLGFVGIGINTGWSGYDWLIALLLYILFWLPGFIFSMIKMMEYY